MLTSAYHGLVVEGEALQLPQCIGGSSKLLEDDEGLPPHPHGLHGHDVYDLAELREEGIERALQLCGGKMGNRLSSEQTLQVSEAHYQIGKM